MVVGAVAAALPMLGIPIGSAQAQRSSAKTGQGRLAKTVERPFSPFLGPRSRVVIVNDISGDPDGLFSTVHAFLSPSTDVRGFVGTGTGTPGETPQESVRLASEILQLMERSGRIPIHAGGQGKLSNATTPIRSAGAQAIVDEAMRTDTKLPLYVTVGAGLTEVASALLMEPRIAEKFTLVWIGGNPHPAGGDEYNFNIDRTAAQVVFNDFPVRIWQVPSDVYGSCQVSLTELQANVAPHGAIGAWLYKKLGDISRKLSRYSLNTGESWTLGDSPLVLLTALTSWVPSKTSPLQFERTGSSIYEEMFVPRLNADGSYEARNSGRQMRVYKSADTRLMFDDMFAKLRLNFG
jgi:inosine-uridine preferring nucleoside hydrolase